MGITPLLLLLSIGVSLFAAIKKPIFGIVAYLIVYLCLDPWSWHGSLIQRLLFGRPAMVVSVAMILACLLNYHLLFWKISRREVAIYCFVILAITISYVFGIGVHDDALKYFDKLIKVSIFLFFLIRAVNSVENFKIIVWTFILSGVFLTYQAHLTTAGYTDGRLDGVGGVDFNDANALASLLILSIYFLGFKLFKSSMRWKFIIIIPIMAMVNAFIMTQSRASFMGLFFGSIYAVLRTPKVIKKEMLIYVLLAVMALGILTHDKFWERMGTIDEESQLLSQGSSYVDSNSIRSRTRVDFWKASIEIFQDYPMGIGVKNFELIVPLYDPGNSGMDAHNTYVLCYSEIGILGIILFLIIIFGSLLQLRRISQLSVYSKDKFEIQMMSLSLTVFLITYLTGAMVTHSYLYSEFTWIVLTLPICLENAVRSSIIAKPDEIIQP